ncbi:hypothetical protein V8B97DRAFT_1617227 [Scleroderma yunnanense]
MYRANKYRDDGLVIDWFSPVPVWADTLKPEPCDLATAIAQTHQANARVRLGTSSPSALKSRVQSVSPRGRSADGSLTKSAVPVSVSQPVAGPSRLGDMRMPGDADGSHSNAIILTGNKLPVPPRASSIRRAIAEKSVGPLSLSPPSTSSQIRVPPTADDDDTIILDGPPLPIRPKSPVRVVTAAVPGSSAPRSSGSYHATPVLDEPIPVGPRQPDAAAEYASTAEREMSEMTLDYLRRYVQTYESDRASLASAYARLASFSYRIHCPGGNTIRASERDPSSDSGLQHGRLDIITTLIKLPSLHCAVALSEPGDTCSGASAVANGVGQLSYDILYLGAKLGMFVVCRAVTPTKMVVHSFMLQRKEVDQEEASVEGVWPMVANVHQIVVFECT